MCVMAIHSCHHMLCYITLWKMDHRLCKQSENSSLQKRTKRKIQTWKCLHVTGNLRAVKAPLKIPFKNYLKANEWCLLRHHIAVQVHAQSRCQRRLQKDQMRGTFKRVQTFQDFFQTFIHERKKNQNKFQTFSIYLTIRSIHNFISNDS